MSYRETYTFSTQNEEYDKVELNENIVSQTIIIDDNSSWNNNLWSVWFEFDENLKSQVDGSIIFSLFQDGNEIDSCKVDAVKLKNGFFNNLNFRKLHSGSAEVIIKAKDINIPIYMGIAHNVYNVPNCYVNGKDTGGTLIQQYHYNYNNIQYKIGLILFGILILLCIGSCIICYQDGKVIYLRGNLILTYLILTYIYDGSLYFQPTWAEAVTNFMDKSLSLDIHKAILSTDAGYLPLMQRVIAIVCINIVHMSPLIALYVMQFVAYFMSGCIFSFFIKKQFDSIMKKEWRYIVCVIMMALFINKETGAFINFMTYSSLIIFLYFITDCTKWSKKEFVFLCIWGVVTCLSKGVYVTMLPLLVVCMVLFIRNYSRRDIIFCLSVAFGALLQLIYYLLGNADWVNTSNQVKDGKYFVKLLLSIFVDTPSRIISIFGEEGLIFNNIFYIIVLPFWIITIYIAYNKILLKILKKQKVDRIYQACFLLLMYIIGQSLFLRVTIYGVNEANIFTDEFWSFTKYEMCNRWEVLIFMSIFVLIIAIIKKIYDSKYKKELYKVALLFILTIIIVYPRFQLKGMGSDAFTADRTSISSLTSEVQLMRGIENAKCRFIPIQPNGWAYNKNASVYCFGTNIYGWGCQTIPSEEPENGAINLLNYSSEINNEAEIVQIFIKKNCLVNNSRYKIVISDENSNILVEQNQDNSEYQMLTSFTFSEGIKHAEKIRVLDKNGKEVHLENAMYIVTNADNPLL